MSKDSEEAKGTEAPGLTFGERRRDLPWVLNSSIFAFCSLVELASVFWANRGASGQILRYLASTKSLACPQSSFARGNEFGLLLAAKRCRSLHRLTIATLHESPR